MNLLNQNKSDSNGKVQTEILNILNAANLSNENRIIAAEFFDFSKEMNLELLEHVEFQEMSTDYRMNNMARNFLLRIEEEHNEYTDRYILFLDAVGYQTITNMLAYNMLHEYTKKDSIFMKQLTHAFSVKYDEEMVQSKIVALLIGPSSGYTEANKYYPKPFLDIIKEKPLQVLHAARCCFRGACKDDQMKLYAFALACMEPAEENASVYEKEVIEDRDAGIALIKEQVANVSLSNEKAFAHTMSACFMALHHDKELKEVLLDKIQKKETEFLIAVLKYAPNQYVAENMDLLLEFLGLEKSPEQVLNCVKEVLAEFGLKSCNIVSKPNAFLAKIAQNYPEQFIKVMRSNETIMSRQYYNRFPVLLCNYYENMYKILETANPDSIQTYQVDFDSELLKLAAESEKENTEKYKEEVYRYLCGENDIFTSEQQYEELCQNSIQVVYIHSKNEDILESCMKHNPLFQKRYYALKAVQQPGILSSMINSAAIQNKIDNIFDKLVDILISEQIPLRYRFETYDTIINHCYACYSGDGQEKVKNHLLKVMSAHKEDMDKEYEAYCKKGGVFTRKVYLQYLEGFADNDVKKKRIFAMCADGSKEIRTLVGESIAKHKEYEKDVLELLQSKKQAVRELAVDILQVWEKEKYKDILLETAKMEKSAKLAEKIYAILETTSVEGESGEKKDAPIQLVEQLHRGGRNKKILWLYETPNQTVHFTNEKEADEKYMQAILLSYANMQKPGINQNAAVLAKPLKPKELESYAVQIFSKWMESGAEAKQKWVLYFAAIHGGHTMIEMILQCIKEWAENLRGAMAGEAVKALALNGSAEALMHVDNMAHKFKHKQVKKAALQALDNAAEELGITSEELGDRIVPNLGFDENMERSFDYGSRIFKVYLTPTLELEVFDEDGKKRKTMPAPSKKDEEEKAKQSNAEFKQMKKQLKNVISIQKLRLENALLADRRWKAEAWQNLFVKNPVMHSFAIGLIWAAYEEDKLVQTFRYMEDGSFNTADEEEYTLTENCTIGLVHPIDLNEEELSAWKEQLCDYEITQPIEQLERKVYHMREDEAGTLDLKRFQGRKVNAFTLLGRMAKLGWLKGSIQDAGCFDTFYREDVLERIKREDGSTQLVGNAAELHFSGMYVGGDDENVEIENIRFYTPGTIRRGSYVYDEADDKKAIKLEKINTRYFSEIVNQVEMVLKGTETE